MKRILLTVTRLAAIVATGRMLYRRYQQARVVWNDPRVAKARAKTVNAAKRVVAKQTAKANAQTTKKRR